MQNLYRKLLLCSSPVRERSEGTFVIFLYFIDEDTEAYRDLLRSHSQLVSEPGGPVSLLHSLNNCISSLLVIGLFHKLW